MIWWLDFEGQDSDQTYYIISVMARSFVRTLLEDSCETFGGLRHLNVNFCLDRFSRLFRDATLDNLHQLLDLCIFLSELIGDGMWTVPAAKPSVVASLLVPILFTICGRCFRVFNQNIELLNLLQHMVIVIRQVLGLFPSLLLKAIV